jgi:hypothetical protein
MHEEVLTMSLDDITLNTRVYTFQSSVGSRVDRIILATGSQTYPTYLEISHANGSGNKPNRHLAKIGFQFSDSNGLFWPASVHLVATQPKGSGDTEFTDAWTDMISLMGTSGFRAAFLAGGFSA